jgi:hypothetical protein
MRWRIAEAYRKSYYRFNEHVVEVGLMRHYLVYPELQDDEKWVGYLHVIGGLSSEEQKYVESLFARVLLV